MELDGFDSMRKNLKNRESFTRKENIIPSSVALVGPLKGLTNTVIQEPKLN